MYSESEKNILYVVISFCSVSFTSPRHCIYIFYFFSFTFLRLFFQRDGAFFTTKVGKSSKRTTWTKDIFWFLSCVMTEKKKKEIVNFYTSSNFNLDSSIIQLITLYKWTNTVVIKITPHTYEAYERFNFVDYVYVRLCFFSFSIRIPTNKKGIEIRTRNYCLTYVRSCTENP